MQEILDKYFQEKATPDEKRLLLNWLRQEGNMKHFLVRKNEWMKNSEFPISKDILLRFTGLQKNILDAGRKEMRLYLFRERIFKYAAVLVLALALTSVLLYSLGPKISEELPAEILPTTMMADNGQMTKALLPDGTMVWLNSGSSLSWDNRYGVNNRNVELKGEGFFSVVPNNELPMNVVTEELIVKVTGTKFNISAYPGVNMVEVVLETGSVELFEPGAEIAVARLDPGKMARLDKGNRKLHISTVNVSRYTSWKEGIINIWEEPLGNLVVRLEKRYNQKFHVEEKVKMYRFTFSIKNENLDDIIRLMESVAPVKTVQENEIIIFKYDIAKARIMEKNR